MANKLTKGMIGALDILFDTSGSGEPFTFTGSDGKSYQNKKLNAGHIPVSQQVRSKLFVGNVDAAIIKLIEHFSDAGAATEALAGIARIATLAEVQDGIFDNLIVTPRKLKLLAATAAIAGLVKLATADDIANSTNPNSVLTVSLAQNLGGLPSGIGPFPWYFPAVPAGYVKADGTLYSRAIFSGLWDACKETAILDTDWLAGHYTAFSLGDGATTFRVPDLRGVFLRGVDGGSGHDPDAASRLGGDAPGSLQEDAVGEHCHLNGFSMVESGTFYGVEESGLASVKRREGADSSSTTSPKTSTVGEGDTRPKNTGVHWIFKV